MANTKPNATQVKYKSETVYSALDRAEVNITTNANNSVRIKDYTELRAYTGPATIVDLTDDGIAGRFSLVGSGTDNGGTLIVGNDGRRWSRLFSGSIHVSWFGAKGDGLNNDNSAIQAAIDSIPFGGEIKFHRGNFILGSTINCSSLGVSLVGEGYGTVLTVNHGDDAFRFTNQLSRFRGFEIQIGVSTNRGGSSVWNVLAGAQTGYIEDVRVTGHLASPNNGMVFREDTHLAGNWSIDRIQISGGVTWTSIVRLSADATLGTCASHWFRNIIGTRVKVLVAMYDFEGAIDTVSGVNVGGDVVGGPVIWCHTPRPDEQYYYPRWLHFSNSFCEAWSSHNEQYTEDSIVPCVLLESCRDFRWVNGYFGSASYGAVVGSHTQGVTIADSQFINLGRSAVSISAGSIGARIHHNSINDVCAAANGAHNAVEVGIGATDFEISNNDFGTTYTNKPFYWISISNGASNAFNISDNTFRNNGVAGLVKNGATGSSWKLENNSSAGTATQSVKNQFSREIEVPGISSPTKAISLNGGESQIITGSGSPEGVVSAAPGCLYLNFAGGAGSALYVKESGAGNTGWVAK